MHNNFTLLVSHFQASKQWADGDAMSTNRTERQCWLLIHLSNVWESYSRALELGCPVWPPIPKGGGEWAVCRDEQNHNIKGWVVSALEVALPNPKMCAQPCGNGGGKYCKSNKSCGVCQKRHVTNARSIARNKRRSEDPDRPTNSPFSSTLSSFVVRQTQASQGRSVDPIFKRPLSCLR